MQVAPCGVKDASAQQPRPCSLHSLVQHVAAAAQSRARPTRDSRAAPTPSCPTPIQHCRGTDEAPAAAGRCMEAALASSNLQQAISAPQLQVAGALVLDSPPSVGDAQPASAAEAARGAGTAHAWATANPSLHCESSSIVQAPLLAQAEQARKVSADESVRAPNTAGGFLEAGPAAASQPEQHSPGLAHQPQEQETGCGHGMSDAGLNEATLPWLHSAQQAARGPQQAAEQSVEQQMDSACAVSAVARSEKGRSGAGAKQVLFLEIQSRLPPRLPGQAGYTDVYDFPDSVLAVADSFLRDAPASQEQPEVGAMPALSDAGIHACSAAAVAATEAATSSVPHGPAEACLPPPIARAGTGAHMASQAAAVSATAHASTQHAAAVERTDRAEPSRGLRRRQMALSAAHEAALRAAAQHASPAPCENPASLRQMQGGHASTGAASAAAASAATGGPDMAQDAADRSCRSSVTPHKADSPGGKASENFADSRELGSAGALVPAQQPGGCSNSSQAAHESQAGISISVRPTNVSVPATSPGAPRGSEHERRCDHDGRPQPRLQMSSPSRGLDMLAAAASTLGGVPKHMAKAARQAKHAGAAAAPAGQKAKPSWPSAPPASPSQKRKATKDVNALHSPTKMQRSSAVISAKKAIPVSPGKVQQGKAARPKTPIKARAAPKIGSPRSREQPEGSSSRPQSSGRVFQNDAAARSAKKVKRAAEKTPGRAADRSADPEHAGEALLQVHAQDLRASTAPHLLSDELCMQLHLRRNSEECLS